MKKYYYIIALFALLFSSCELDSNTEQFQFEVMPITSVVVPQEFIFGETHTISVSYTKPSNCYQFNDFIYNIDGAERIISVLNTVYTQNSQCTGEPETVSVDFNYTVSSTETHIFKFFQGFDEQGADQYHIFEIPVITQE